MKRVHPGFTKRARCLLAAGVAAVVCGAVLSEQELVRGGAFAAVIPIVAAIVVGRERLTISSTRRLEPNRTAVGERAIVQLTVTSRSALPTSSLMLEDTLPRQARGRARFVLDRLSPHQTRTVGYRLPELPRGEHAVGPLHIRLTDPFGLIDRTRSFTARSTLLVTPKVELLPRGSTSLVAGFGDGVASAYIGSNGVDDHTTREYRDGDDLRRIHWRLTARAGTLMVRQDEQPAPSDIMLALDVRFSAHPISSSGAGEPAVSASFEWLVSAAASIASHLITEHRPVTILDTPQNVGGIRFAARDELLTYLALAQPRQDVHASEMVDRMAAGADHSMTIALLAGLDEATAQRMVDKARGRGRSLAIVIDTDSYGELEADSPPTAARPGSGGATVEVDQTAAAAASWAPSAALQHACGLLRAAGWTVSIAGPGESVTNVWSRLLGQPELLGGLR
ncbi:uncharacterized protein DUF58 [Jatrophihabitans sp. GAS493]|uniref:DUF58 domain-containing protein n=1 Tax=Jatrophihabitans sp. GAS493 TaxID=1907575 RepID=UPI000BB7029C|nr:DUF58 domain-containing protein [Jatrophihabitans sp. GAS493]SOD74337.1 uncharacterized protein DUF58 [Jatrophihabitans sp. GAS493]